MAPPREDGHAAFGALTQADADSIAAKGTGNNVPGNILTTDGNASPTPSNRVKIFLSMGAWNALQQADAHAYWEFNPYTDWVFPTYEFPSTSNGSGCAYPLHCERKGQWVVSRFSITNGLTDEPGTPPLPAGDAGRTNSYRYHYYNGRSDLQGRGWLGFESVKRVDEQTK